MNHPRTQSTESSPKPRSWQKWLIWMLQGAAVGWLISYLDGGLIDFIDRFDPELVIALVLSPILYYFAVAFHEMGHLLGGLLVGFQFQFFIIGPLVIYRQTKGLKCRLSKALLMGGMAGTFPTDVERQYIRRTSIVVASGPLASLLLTLLGVWLCFAASYIFKSQATLVTFLAGVLALLSLFLAIVSIVPSQIEGMSTDGDRLLKLFTNDPTVKYDTALLAVNAESFTGKRPSNWNTDWIKLLLSAPEGSYYRGSGYWCAFYQALDRQDVVQAEEHLSMALSTLTNLTKIIQSPLMFEAAFFYAFYKQDLAAAKEWLHQAKRDSLNPHIQLRAEAAVLLAEQDVTGVHQKIQKAMSQLKHSLNLGMAIAERDWLTEIASRANKLS